MNEDDEKDALANQQLLEAERLLWEDAEAYNRWLDQLAHQEFEERNHA